MVIRATHAVTICLALVLLRLQSLLQNGCIKQKHKGLFAFMERPQKKAVVEKPTL